MMTSSDTEYIDILDASQESLEAQQQRTAPKPIADVLPILGLADIVIFPGMTVPLLVESAPSIRLIDDVVAGDRILGLVLQRKPEVENPLPEDLFEIGCAGRILKMLKFPDNTVRVLVEGLRRVKIREYESQVPFLRAKIDPLKDEVDDSAEFTALARNARRQFEEVLNLSPTLSDQIKIASIDADDAGRMADLITANLNLKLDRTPATPGTGQCQRPLEQIVATSRSRDRSADLRLQNPEGSRLVHVEEPARLLPARAIASHSTRTRRFRSQCHGNQYPPRSSRSKPTSRRSKKGRAARIGTVAANPTRRRRIHRQPQLSGLARQLAMEQIDRG